VSFCVDVRNDAQPPQECEFDGPGSGIAERMQERVFGLAERGSGVDFV
jgi:hypothetical protein